MSHKLEHPPRPEQDPPVQHHGAEPMGGRAYGLEIIDCRARIAAVRGDGDGRHAALESGLSTAREMGAQGWEERFGESLGAAHA